MKNCPSWDVEAGAAVPEAGTAVDAASPAGPVRALSTEKGPEKFQTSLVFHQHLKYVLATWMLPVYLQESLSQA